MDSLAFHTLRKAIQSNARPGASDELDELGQVYRDTLTESGLFSDLEVAATENEDELIAATCHYDGQLEPDAVAQALERLWSERLSHPFWAIHSVKRTGDEVALEGASRLGSDGPYVTVRVTARSAAIPRQRVAPEDAQP
jgi:hypothetical protein